MSLTPATHGDSVEVLFSVIIFAQIDNRDRILNESKSRTSTFWVTTFSLSQVFKDSYFLKRTSLFGKHFSLNRY